MPDAQPKPTAAEVLRGHGAYRVENRGGVLRARCQTDQVWRTLHGHAQHQADMLAAAGLLATAEHSCWDTVLAEGRPRIESLAEHAPQPAAADDLAGVAHAVAEAYQPAGQAIWWRSWAEHPERRAGMQAGVLGAWSGETPAAGAGEVGCPACGRSDGLHDAAAGHWSEHTTRADRAGEAPVDYIAADGVLALLASRGDAATPTVTAEQVRTAAAVIWPAPFANRHARTEQGNAVARLSAGLGALGIEVEGGEQRGTPQVCASTGPRIGDVRPRCGQPLGHDGPHRGFNGSGFERVEWLGPLMRDAEWAARQQEAPDA